MLCLGVPAVAESEQEKARSQLQALQREMQKITREISSEKTRKNTLLQQLRTAEKELAQLQLEIRDNTLALAETGREIDELKVQRKALELARDEQQATVAKELKNAYQMGRQGQVKVLLNQESPDTVARTMAYYRYFLSARSEHLQRYRETLAELAIVEGRINSLAQTLKDTGLALEKQQKNLSRARQTREVAVSSLTASIQTKGGKLKALEDDRKELEQLLEAIEIAVVNLQVPDNYKAFKSAKGEMPWPISGGKPSNRYGKYRNEGKMRWQGVSIPASEGTSVTAIHHGRVVYADWFRGSGLLLIIDHGDGYMSLYAHNQTLLKEVGEWVSAGTPVSTVGSSGGQERSALYFEIRHAGKPTNPASWCRG